jgi:hypothetical protein
VRYSKIKSPFYFFKKTAMGNPSPAPAGSWPKNEKGGQKCLLMNSTAKNVKKILVW